MQADADRTKQHRKELHQRDWVHKLDKKVVAKRHDSEMTLKIKECNSDMFSMLKEYEEKEYDGQLRQVVHVEIAWRKDKGNEYNDQRTRGGRETFMFTVF